MKANPAAFEAGQLAERLAQGYYSHSAAIEIARDSRAKALVSTILQGQAVPVSRVSRKDGTHHVFDFHHYLDQAHSRSDIAQEIAKVWLVGSLLSVGDVLSKANYFDHAPELELLYHLRNGVAHGNRFHFRPEGLKRLSRHPAHNRYAWIRSGTKAEFEILPSDDGKPVLFDFMGPADVVDLLQSLGLYLIRMGNGDALRPSGADGQPPR